MSSSLDIVNRAFDLLYQEPVSDIDNPTSKNEKLGARWYDATRKRLLAYHPWDFAEGRYSCSRSGTPKFGYTDMYRLPNDFIELVEIEGENDYVEYSSVYGDIDWTREGNDLLLNANGVDSVNIVYTRDFKDATKFSAMFEEALEYKLAVALCIPVTKDRKLRADLVSLADDVVNKATSIDGQGKRVRRKERSRSIAARRSGSSPSNAYRVR